MTRWLRRSTQVVIVAATAVVGVRFALGWSLTSVETYCPFGGLETAYALVTRQRFTCAAGELNLALLVSLAVLTLLARKAFCGWACPLGATLEWTGRLTRRVFRTSLFEGPWRVPAKVDAALKVSLRLLVLTAVLGATWVTGELVFRTYDPYYVMFSAHGHDIRAWSYGVLGAVLLLAFLVPMSWCKYLCPLGAALWPAASIGRLRLHRTEQHCTACGACDRACPQALAVSTVREVRSGECTLCLECTGACPAPGALGLHLSARTR